MCHEHKKTSAFYSDSGGNDSMSKSLELLSELFNLGRKLGSQFCKATSHNSPILWMSIPIFHYGMERRAHLLCKVTGSRYYQEAAQVKEPPVIFL